MDATSPQSVAAPAPCDHNKTRTDTRCRDTPRPRAAACVCVCVCVEGELDHSIREGRGAQSARLAPNLSHKKNWPAHAYVRVSVYFCSPFITVRAWVCVFG